MTDYENDTFVEEEGKGPLGLPGPGTLHTVIGLQVLFVIVGGVGNSLVLYLYGRRGEKLTYITGILALAGKDLACCCLLLPCCIIVESYQFFLTSDFFCKLYHFLGNVNSPMTVFLLMFLGMDRCVCVFKGYIQSTYQRRAVITVAIVTVSSITVAIAPSLAFGVYGKDRTPHNPMNTSRVVEEKANDIVMLGICHFNHVLISLESMMAFYTFTKFLIFTPPVVMVICYTTMFGAYLFRKYSVKPTILDSPLDGVGEKSVGRGDSSTMCKINESPHETTAKMEESYDKQADGLEREQHKMAVLFFIVTCAFYVIVLPATLMAFGHVAINYIVFHLYQLHYVVNPFIYLCLDSMFQKEVKDLFLSNWSRLVH